MALAEYFDRAELAASQVITGFAPIHFRQLLGEVHVGLAVDQEAAKSEEGQTLTELTIRLLARLYPSLEIRAGTSSEGERLERIARSINPRIEFKGGASVGVVVGIQAKSFETSCFAGSNGWDALLSTKNAIRSGCSPNTLGASASACLAAGWIFNHLLLQISELCPTGDLCLSTYNRDFSETSHTVPNEGIELPADSVLVGIGAVGNAATWALGRSTAKGVIQLVDPECLELSNCQRYVLASRADEGTPKVDIAMRFLNGNAAGIPQQMAWADFVNRQGYLWQHVLVALDSARDRRSVQASLPRWTANAWTQPGDLGVSVHGRFDGDGACLSCLYLPTNSVPNEDHVVAESLAVPQLVADVRTLLHTGAGVSHSFLEAVAEGLGLPREQVASYEGRSIRDLYVKGICGGGLIPLGTLGLPSQDLHVPLAHQSALAGVLLAATLLGRGAGKEDHATLVSRVDVTRPLGEFMTQPMLKARSGQCICEDQDYINAYRAKFGENRKHY